MIFRDDDREVRIGMPIIAISVLTLACLTGDQHCHCIGRWRLKWNWRVRRVIVPNRGRVIAQVLTEYSGDFLWLVDGSFGHRTLYSLFRSVLPVGALKSCLLDAKFWGVSGGAFAFGRSSYCAFIRHSGISKFGFHKNLQRAHCGFGKNPLTVKYFWATQCWSHNHHSR